MQAIQIKVACIRDGLDDEFLTRWVGRGYHPVVAGGLSEVSLAGLLQKPRFPKGLGFGWFFEKCWSRRVSGFVMDLMPVALRR